ncbi:MAG: biopolymer transport protein ExbD/TolR [Steroidobacteraceae bacterium]|jgi:biopolymer transport protein ExbD|nr:biopolymer transport protein ExbD/TolR [Steroidobacteraceae bacterium]MBM2853752.1 biopolymer transport protein ExbD/TolR [Steroidobacteraceae bacterium]
MAIAVGKDEGDPMVEPNVIPLVDVMLVLLIIMIITVPVMIHAVKIDLPKEVNRPTETKPENINLSIDFDGGLYWNDNGIDRDSLLNYVLQEAVKDPQPEVHIRADKRARYEYVADTLYVLQRGGMRKVGFIAERPKGE